MGVFEEELRSLVEEKVIKSLNKQSAHCTSKVVEGLVNFELHKIAKKFMESVVEK